MKNNLDAAALDISSLATLQLFELNAAVMQELQRRMSQPKIESQPEEIQKVVFAPKAFEVTFINNTLREAKKGYVTANIKDQYKELHKRYPEWFQLNHYPSDLRGRDFREWNTYYSK
ncbi:hypothetical protein CWS43_26815 [Rahnella sp. AA]|uniref:hypothetical protein n=1 Tax=Rahnella sp. AA TaxID=2057180 RepID=UPI000C32CA70|nr:hypothetical protein [Rahnella sp. AA]PKE27459.1 hypothetical protein CWS43_26815 [Rahnella sp. AA]